MGVPLSPSRPEEPEPEPGWDVGRCCRIIQKKLIHFFPFALLFVFFFLFFGFIFSFSSGFVFQNKHKDTQGLVLAPRCVFISSVILFLKAFSPLAERKSQ